MTIIWEGIFPRRGTKDLTAAVWVLSSTDSKLVISKMIFCKNQFYVTKNRSKSLLLCRIKFKILFRRRLSEIKYFGSDYGTLLVNRLGLNKPCVSLSSWSCYKKLISIITRANITLAVKNIEKTILCRKLSFIAMLFIDKVANSCLPQ